MLKPKKNQQQSDAVLFLTASAYDAALAVNVLEEAGIEALACTDLKDLCARIQDDWGAIVLSDEVVNTDNIHLLHQTLDHQETWSDIPLILLTGTNMERTNEMFSRTGNVSLLERPFSRLTLVRSVHVALRARKRQYQVRDLLRALRASKDEAERANVAKTEFLANMSHEIRTPIGAILGFLDLMKNPSNNPSENHNYMGVVERNSNQLLRLIDDILDLSKVEAGKMTIERLPFRFTDLLADLNSIMTFKAQEKGIEFRLLIEGLIPEEISTDPVRLRQILGNILGNAVKFTENGRVDFTVAYKEPFLKFTVKDTGIGISKKQENKLFQPFSQADMSTTRQFGGTGLGLILSKRLSEALGGSLELTESTPSKGSTFSISIKIDPSLETDLIGKEALLYSKTQYQFEESDQALKGLKVLLVEDSPDNQILITTYLGNAGAEIRTASDGLQGLELATNENFDVVLMDVQMPRMDGHEATRKLREFKYKKPIVALTAHAMSEEREKCFQSGFTDFLTKPIQRDHLLDVLSRYTPEQELGRL